MRNVTIVPADTNVKGFEDRIIKNAIDLINKVDGIIVTDLVTYTKEVPFTEAEDYLIDLEPVVIDGIRYTGKNAQLKLLQTTNRTYAGFVCTHMATLEYQILMKQKYIVVSDELPVAEIRRALKLAEVPTTVWSDNNEDHWYGGMENITGPFPLNRATAPYLTVEYDGAFYCPDTLIGITKCSDKKPLNVIKQEKGDN